MLVICIMHQLFYAFGDIAAEGILYSGCPCEREYVIIYKMIVYSLYSTGAVGNKDGLITL